ncbi:MAG: leucine-rich repeat domain-containing protein [Bacteroidales bacterium]
MRRVISYRTLLIILFALTLQSAWASTFVVDNLKFTILDSSKREVSISMDSEIIGDLVIPESISYMGETYRIVMISSSGFANTKTISSVVIPSSVSTIGEKAFEGCSSLQSINIPNKVIRIENSTFRNCSSLSTIVLSTGTTSIGISAFEGCSSLIHIDIPQTVTSLGTSAFAYCSSLETIKLHSNISSIRWYTFTNCSSLVSVSIPEGIDIIGLGAFSHCTSLESIDIPTSIKTIEASAFYKCSSLRDIKIPHSTQTIGSMAFRHCNSLDSLEIPRGTTNIGNLAFSDCERLLKVIMQSDTPPTSYTSSIFSGISSINLYTPPTSEHLYYQDPNWSGFANYIAVGDKEPHKTNIHIEKGGSLEDIISLDDKIYYLSLSGEINGSDIAMIRHMSGRDKAGNKTDGELRYLDISNCRIIQGGGEYINGYQPIGDEIPPYMFKDCIIVEIKLPESIHSINSFAFFNSNVIALSLPSGIKTIRKSAFRNCKFIKELTIPEGVRSIEEYTFSECKYLETIAIPYGTTSIGDNAFEHCSSLKYINIPNSVTTIGKQLFANCSSLREVTLSNILEEIPDLCFNNCNKLDSITIPESVNSIGESAFSNCEALSSIHLPKNLVSLGISSFYSCTSLNTITLPDPIKSIPNRCFIGCRSLNSVYIGDKLESVGTLAFSGVTELEELHIKRRTPPSVSSNSFSSYGKTNLYVPLGSIFLYEKAPTWSMFDNISGTDGILVKASIESNQGGNVKINGSELDHIEISLGEDVTFEIVVQEGFVIKTVHLNRDDVTSELSDENLLIVNNVFTDLSLDVDFDLLSSSSETTGSTIRVYKKSGNVIAIESLEPGDMISIYNAMGSKLRDIIATGRDESLELNSGTLYIVTVAGRSFKVAL